MSQLPILYSNWSRILVKRKGGDYQVLQWAMRLGPQHTDSRANKYMPGFSPLYIMAVFRISTYMLVLKPYGPRIWFPFKTWVPWAVSGGTTCVVASKTRWWPSGDCLNMQLSKTAIASKVRLSHSTYLTPSTDRDKCGPEHRPRVHRWLVAPESWRYGSRYNLVEPAGTRTDPFFQLSTYLHTKTEPLIKASTSFTPNKRKRHIQSDDEDMQWYGNLSILLVTFLEVNMKVYPALNRMYCWGWWNHDDQSHSMALEPE